MIAPSRDHIRRIVLDPGFWDGYLEAEYEDDLPEGTSRLRLLTAGERTLDIEVMQNPNLMRVGLWRGDVELPQLGYDDDAAAYLPWIFRWEELERIARLAALRDPDLRHPGPVVALLSRFTPVTTPEEVAVARPVLEAALRTLREGPELPEPREEPTLDERLAYHREHWDNCAGYRWVRDDGGWVLDGEYTMREQGNTEFPHRDLAMFLADVEAALAETVAPARQILAGVQADPAGRLREAGFEHPVVLRALLDPIDPYERHWVLDLLRG